MHLFPDMANQSLIHHTRYKQYDSMVRTLINWLTDRGVQYVGKTRVTDIGLGNETDGEITARGIMMVQAGKKKKVEVRPEDIVIVTLGLMVANVSFGSNDSAPELITSPTHEGKWYFGILSLESARTSFVIHRSSRATLTSRNS